MYISASVGQGGRNQEADVFVIPNMLSARGRMMNPSLRLPKTGKPHDAPYKAFKRFQKELMLIRSPNGVVNAPGNTLDRLESGLQSSGSVGHSGMTHRNDVDLVRITDPKNLSGDRTKGLVDVLRTDTNPRQIFFNGSAIDKKCANVKYYNGRHNHRHVSFKD